jgi:hypothetical protein
MVSSSFLRPSSTSRLLFTPDGPYIYEQDIAGHLADAGSKGTFFFNGNSEHYPFGQKIASKLCA